MAISDQPITTVCIPGTWENNAWGVGGMTGKNKIKNTQDCFLVLEHHYKGCGVGG